MGEQVKDLCNRLREDLLEIEQHARSIKRRLPPIGDEVVFNAPEAIAQSILAVRHIEDARMRLGKVIQHMRDGVSCYDQGTKESQP